MAFMVSAPTAHALSGIACRLRGDMGGGAAYNVCAGEARAVMHNVPHARRFSVPIASQEWPELLESTRTIRTAGGWHGNA